MDASGNDLVDQFETAFLNCVSTLTSQEHFNVTDPDEVKSSVDQNITKFLTLARQLESSFLEKRQMLAHYRPDDILKDDNQQLKSELERKDQLIAKHHEKLQQWQNLLRVHNQQHQQQSHDSSAQGGTQQAGASHGGATGYSQQQGPLASLEQTTSNIGSTSDARR